VLFAPLLVLEQPRDRCRNRTRPGAAGVGGSDDRIRPRGEVVRALVTGVVLIMEMTAQTTLVPPMVVCAVSAVVVATLLHGRRSTTRCGCAWRARPSEAAISGRAPSANSCSDIGATAISDPTTNPPAGSNRTAALTSFQLTHSPLRQGESSRRCESVTSTRPPPERPSPLDLKPLPLHTRCIVGMAALEVECPSRCISSARVAPD
jgi:hypothetical protein